MIGVGIRQGGLKRKRSTSTVQTFQERKLVLKTSEVVRSLDVGSPKNRKTLAQLRRFLTGVKLGI